MLKRLIPIIREVFDDEDFEPTLETRPSEVETWDSLSNIRLFLAVEKAFSFRFDTAEIGSVENVGEFVDRVLAKRAS
ncbi:MAG: acyl carrier protein [Magnetococcales bacterium]|nr:acyl carrier protein [Magnetococcales bacterium]